MNKKLLIAMGLITALSAATISAMADTTIYTDDLGRMHFLGRDAASNTGVRKNYSNSAEQDLTRKLYENSTGELNYVDHPLKNYENTFSDSRFTTTSAWKKNYENNVDEARVSKKTAVEAQQGSLEGLNPYMNTQEAAEKGEKNVVKTTKKHWWNK